jgi:hypothetical protein
MAGGATCGLAAASVENDRSLAARLCGGAGVEHDLRSGPISKSESTGSWTGHDGSGGGGRTRVRLCQGSDNGDGVKQETDGAGTPSLMMDGGSGLDYR